MSHLLCACVVSLLLVAVTPTIAKAQSAPRDGTAFFAVDSVAAGACR